MASIITSVFQASSLLNSAKGLFVGGQKTKIGDLVIDASLSEVITNSSNITEHPVESKISISDHIFKNPLKVKIQGYITNSPPKFMGILELPLQNNSVSKLVNSAQSFLPFGGGSTKPSMQAYQLLKKAQENRELITVVTKLDAFKNMAIENLTFDCNEDTGERLEFSAELMQLTFASVKTTTNTSYVNKAVSAIAGKKDNLGLGETSEETSVIKKAWNGVKGYFKGAFSTENMNQVNSALPFP